MDMNTIAMDVGKMDINSLIDKLAEKIEPTIVRNNKGKQIVLMLLKENNSWQETIYLLSNPANAKHLRKSIEKIQKGNITERELID